jgi:two-component system, cell cycle sensor histidine kinase PleC
MTNVTADTIALGMAGDRVAAIPRGRLAAEVHEAPEKLISSAPSRHAFDVELLRLFARDRRSSAPTMAGIGAVVAAVAASWVDTDKVLLWIVLDASALCMGYLFASKLLAADMSKLDPTRWRWKFIVAETFQGVTWAVIVWLIGRSGNLDARGFVLVLHLLVAAMNATISASIPSTVTGALTPMTLATLGFFCSTFPTGPSL